MLQYHYTRFIKPQDILLGFIFVVIGVGLLLYSVVMIREYHQKNETYVEATSRIVDYTYNDEGLEAFIVEYTIDGQSYRKTSNSYSNIHKSKGTKVMIKYNPKDPSDAIWVHDSINIIIPLFGGAFALAGICAVVFGVKGMKKEKNAPVVQQANGLYDSADIVNSLQSNQNLCQQNSSFQQTEQSQDQYVQDSVIQNANDSNQTNNQK